MISARQTLAAAALISVFSAYGCGFGSGAEDTELAVIDKNTFLFLVHETPTFATDVMASLAQRLRG